MQYDEGRDLIICIIELITSILKSEKKISSILKKKKITTSNTK